MLGINSTETPTSREAKFKPTLKYAVTCNFFLFKILLSLLVCTYSHAHAYGNTHEQACAHTHLHAHVTSHLWLLENHFEELSSSVTSVCILETELQSQGLHRRAFTCFPILLALQLSILSSPCITVLIGLVASCERLV